MKNIDMEKIKASINYCEKLLGDKSNEISNETRLIRSSEIKLALLRNLNSEIYYTEKLVSEGSDMIYQTIKVNFGLKDSKVILYASDIDLSLRQKVISILSVKDMLSILTTVLQDFNKNNYIHEIPMFHLFSSIRRLISIKYKYKYSNHINSIEAMGMDADIIALICSIEWEDIQTTSSSIKLNLSKSQEKINVHIKNHIERDINKPLLPHKVKLPFDKFYVAAKIEYKTTNLYSVESSTVNVYLTVKCINTIDDLEEYHNKYIDYMSEFKNIFYDVSSQQRLEFFDELYDHAKKKFKEDNAFAYELQLIEGGPIIEKGFSYYKSTLSGLGCVIHDLLLYLSNCTNKEINVEYLEVDTIKTTKKGDMKVKYRKGCMVRAHFRHYKDHVTFIHPFIRKGTNVENYDKILITVE